MGKLKLRLHIHWYKLVEDQPDYNWGGIICRRQLWRCRICPAVVTRMSGKMPL